MIVPFHGKKIPSFSCHKVKKPGKTVEMPGGDCYNGILQTPYVNTPAMLFCLYKVDPFRI